MDMDDIQSYITSFARKLNFVELADGGFSICSDEGDVEQNFTARDVVKLDMHTLISVVSECQDGYDKLFCVNCSEFMDYCDCDDSILLTDK